MFNLFLIALLFINYVSCQINLGSLNINKNPRGDLEFGVGQSANIFGFGGDRSLGFVAGPGKFDTQLGGGALIGGERLGLDGGVGVQEGQNVNVGSQLKFGNAPPNPNDPAGQLNSFINNVGYFFQRFMPPPGQIPPSSVPRPASLGTIGINSGERSLGTIGVNSGEGTVFETTEIPILETTERKITTEGKKRLRPPIPDGFESLETIQ